MLSASERSKWHIFLDSLYNEFSEYEIQKETSKYNVANLEDWGKSGKPQGVAITKNTFKPFLNLLRQYNITARNDVRNIDVTDFQLKELNNVLSSTLKHEIIKSCSTSQILLIKGIYVKLSDLVKNDGAINILDECEVVKSINIFALNTIFIDKDILQRDLKIPISIISPKWKIIGNRTINLNGTHGKSHTSPASHGTMKGEKGQDGEHGKPGRSGGTFFGVGEHFVGGRNLNITANGGDGGKGQDGGNGYKGADGMHGIIKTDSVGCYKNWCTPNSGIRGFGHIFNCKMLLYHNSGTDPPVVRCEILVYGKSGGKGGDGGNGGKGGKGGNSGNVILLELNDTSHIFKSSKRGDDGAGGSGGIGGQGGINGDNVYMSYETYFGWHSLTVSFNERRNISGRNGIDGFEEAWYPEKTAFVSQHATVVNEYKNYLLENLDDTLLSSSLIHFLNKINHNSTAKGLYNTLELVNELKMLETQFHRLYKAVNLIPIYESLLERVSEYAQNHQRIESSLQYKKVLSYLYSAILSKICNLRSSTETNLIININEHLDIVMNDIKTLKNIQEVQNKVDIIRKYKESYKNGVDKKIEDASYFVDSQIIPEMSKIFSGINDQIELLINDTIALQEEAYEEKHRLVQKRQDLEKALELRGLFNGLKIIGQVLSFLGPLGGVAGTVIGLAGVTSEYLTLDAQINQDPLLKLPASVTTNLRTLGDQFKNAKHRKIVHLNRLIDEISQEINKFPDKLNNTSMKITEIKSKLKNIDSNDLDGIRTLENDLKRELKIREGELKFQKIEADQRTANALAVIEKCNQITHLAILGFDVYNKYKSDETKLSALANAVEQSEEKFKKLKEYEKMIDNIIFPMLKNLEDSIFEITSKLGSKSRIYLDITKWQIQDSLKNFKRQLGKLTEGFEEKDDLIHHIEKLQDVMTTLITVYDRIQYYSEQQNLVNYITDISSVAANNIDISDSVLRDSRNNLEILIRSNLVLRQYNTAIEAFKKFVFPLAHLYLGDSMLPSHLQTKNSLESLVYESVRNIKNLKSKIQEYKSYLNGTGYNPHVMVGEFNSQNFSTEPFFVWKNEQYKDEISSLLSGKKVVITADIKGSSPHEHAIKFRIAEFHFKGKNGTIQSEIDNIFRGFEIVATHLGNSYYKCGNKVYVITSNSTTISYYLEKKSDGEPVRKSVTYVDIKKGDIILSPYATWELVLMESTRKISFNALEVYKNKLDLELIGEGSYFDNRRVNFSGLMIDNYYEAIGDKNKLHISKYSHSPIIKRHKRETEIHKYSKKKISSRKICCERKNWFSWIKFPKITSFSGAEGLLQHDKKLVNREDIFTSRSASKVCKHHQKASGGLSTIAKVMKQTSILIDCIKAPYQKTNKLMKSLSANESKMTVRLTSTNSSVKQTNFADYMGIKRSTDVIKRLSLSGDDKNDNVLNIWTEWLGNLTLAQLVTHKICGPNKTLHNAYYYISPEHIRKNRINDLEKEIMPSLKNDYTNDNIRDIHENESHSWYRDLFKDESV